MFSMLLKVSLVVVCFGLALAQYQYPGQTNSYRPSYGANGQRPGSPSSANPNSRIFGLLGGGGGGLGGLLGGGNRGGGGFGSLLGNLFGGGNRYPNSPYPSAGLGGYGGYPGGYGGYPGAYGGYPGGAYGGNPGYGGVGGYYG